MDIVVLSPTFTRLGENVLTTVGAATTVYGALAGLPGTASPARVTPVVVLVKLPPAVPVTCFVIAQLAPMPSADAPPREITFVRLVAVTAPPQVFVAATALLSMPPGKVSENASVFTATPVLLVSTNVIVESPPTSNVGAEKALVIETLPTNRVAEAVLPVPAFVDVTAPVVLT